jgi:hypothetical protein
MAVGNQPAEQIHKATDRTAMTRVLNLATVLELVNRPLARIKLDVPLGS